MLIYYVRGGRKKNPCPDSRGFLHYLIEVIKDGLTDPFQVHSYKEDTVKVGLDIGGIGRYGVEQVHEKKNSSEPVAKHAANPALIFPFLTNLFFEGRGSVSKTK